MLAAGWGLGTVYLLYALFYCVTGHPGPVVAWALVVLSLGILVFGVRRLWGKKDGVGRTALIGIVFGYAVGVSLGVEWTARVVPGVY